jgi:hypothetical protein
MATRTIPESTKISLGQRQRERWPGLACACGLYLGDPTAWREHLPPANP